MLVIPMNVLTAEYVNRMSVGAIITDAQDPNEVWYNLNYKYGNTWPNITEKKEAYPDAEKYADMPNKLEEHFSEAPGEGD